MYNLLGGLSILNSKKLDPRTCSERICHSSDYLLYATWISSKVDIHSTDTAFKLQIGKLILMTVYPHSFQVEMGCDCCKVNNELVPDKHTWIIGQHTYGKNVTKLFHMISFTKFYYCKSAAEVILFSNKILKNH